MRFVLALIGCLLPLSLARGDKLVLVAGGESVPAAEMRLQQPFGVAFDRASNLYLVEMTANRVRKLDRQGILSAVAGTGAKGDAGDGGPAAKATLNGPHSLVAYGDELLITDTWNNRVRNVDLRTGTIAGFAGTGHKGFAGDGGLAVRAAFNGVYCAALDPKNERLYLADLDNHRIRVIDLQTGTVETVAGNGQKGVPTDGADAKRAPLVDPRAVAVDANGNVYILERSGNALRVVDAAGKIRTVAGTGKKGLSGDGGPALEATFNGPKHLCVDGRADVLIADTENHVIRKYLAKEGKIVRVAGTGKKGTAGLGGPPLEAELAQPHGVTVGPDGLLYISDSTNNRILRIE